MIRLITPLVIAVLLPLTAAAQSADTDDTAVGADIDVSVVLSPFWERNADRLNRIEQTKEERFRHYRIDEAQANRSIYRLNRTRLAGTDWAGERLIDDVEEYTLTNLVVRLVQHNLGRADVEPAGTVRVTIDRLSLTNPDLAVLSGATNWAKGQFAVVDADGNVRQSVNVSTNFVANPTVESDYDGPAYAFLEFDQTQRVGPLLAQFVEEGLSKLYPDQSDDFHGPIMVRPVLSAPTTTRF